MKNIISFILLAFVGMASAQVAIGGKETFASTSVLLEFEDQNNTKGIIVPAVENTANALSTTPANSNGTFLFDKSDKKFKVYSNNAWMELTEAGSTAEITPNTATEQVTEQAGVIIGNNTTNTKGALVLNHPEKAMVLPKVSEPHLNVKQPYPGMMCYDTKSKSLAVFNGENWYYWK